MAVGLVDGLDRTEIRPDTQAPEIQAPARQADTKRRWGGLLPPRRDAELERLRQLEGARAVLERARALIAQGWVQDAFYVVRGRNGERRPVSPFGLLLLTRTDVVGACLVGAVAHASGSVDRRDRRGQAALAVDTLWHDAGRGPVVRAAADGALRRGAPGRPRGQGPRAGPVERRAGPHPRRGARAGRPGGVPDDPALRALTRYRHGLAVLTPSRIKLHPNG